MCIAGCSSSNSNSNPNTAPTTQTPCSNPKCCCCVTSVSIGNVVAVGGTPQYITSAGTTIANGHVFDFTIRMSFCGGATTGKDCTLEWWEKVNLPAVPGHPPNTWTDLYATYPVSPTFNPWKTRSTRCPGGGASTVVIVDVPSLGNPPGVTQTRTLEFRLVIKSGAGCSCSHTSATATATQVLQMVNGNLVGSGTFTIGGSSTTP